MGLFSKYLSLTILLGFGLMGKVQAALYEPIPNSEGMTGLVFSIPYTLGIHEGVATQVMGEVEIDPSTLGLVRGEISIPVSALESGNMKRDCHIQESLGLDYAKSSFPNAHVCDDFNHLPTEGKDSIAFPALTFRVESESLPETSFEMHGVRRPLTAAIQISEVEPGKLRLKANFQLSLSAYGVVVMPVRGISVEDVATVTVDLFLKLK